LELMHSLLRWQLKRHFKDPGSFSGELRKFVAAVDRAYRQSDVDREMLERSLEQSLQKLHRAESERNAIFEGLPELFFRFGLDGTILDCKAGKQTDFYPAPESMIGKKIRKITVPGVAEKFERAIRRVCHTNAQCSIEYSLQVNDKTAFYEARLLPLMENEIIAIIRDATKHKQAENDLRDREQLLEATLEATADGILVVNEEGKATHSNQRFSEMWRIPPELIDSKDDESLLEYVLQQLADPEAFLSKVRALYASMDRSFDTIYFKDGRVFERFSSPLTNDGRVAGRVWSFRDVTKRRHYEKRVESLNLLRERLLGPGTLGEKLNRITKTAVEILNADFARIWILKPADKCNRDCYHASVGDKLYACKNRKQCLHLAASSGRYTHIDGKMHQRIPLGSYEIGQIASSWKTRFHVNDIRKDPNIYDKKWASELGLESFAGYRILSSDSGTVGVLAFFSKHEINHDELAFGEILASTASNVIQAAIAEEQKISLQEKLERAERMESLGILAGGVAHDLNNILGPLVAYPELILMKLPEDSPITRQLNIMSESARDAAEVIQDLLTLARRGRYEKAIVQLNDVIKKYLGSASFQTLQQEKSNVEIILDLDPKLAPLHGSASHLSKVIMNLVVNAMDAMPLGGKLTIQTRQQNIKALRSGYNKIEPGDYAILSVRDTGIGMEKECMQKIFEPYFSKKKMGRSGSGLGLSVVYGIVKDHKGYYDIFSTIGQGSEFVFYIPVSNVSIQSEAAGYQVKGGTESILIVDDDPRQRQLSRDIVESLGYNVAVAVNGREAVEYLQELRADLVMLDMIMEDDFDGLDTYREITKIHPGQKAIIVSGFSATERVQEMQSLGAGAYVRKPYTREKIGIAIRNELDKSHNPVAESRLKS
jgi:signal transduction histidine kinase/PAS domain-containing protein/ActR/RegA family two-component response regulator